VLFQPFSPASHCDLVARYPPSHRGTKEAIGAIRLLSPSGERVSLAQLCSIKVVDGASEFYREANSRYVGIIYRVRGRNLGGTVEEAISKVANQVELPRITTWNGRRV
jgi:cobalt-zinc-cadmium resistance protein CzcA